GMWTFDKYILNHFENGLIDENTAKAYASRRSVVARGMDTIKAARGEKTTDIDELLMDKEYNRKVRRTTR
ncbi:MAG: twitching motility protein, partial [Nitrospinales bacterium]